jgi:hypothetical protein
MKTKRLIERLVAGQVKNVRFADFTRLVESFGFRLRRTEGSHHIYGHARLAEQLNLQNVRGEAKPYQVRQFLRLIERYNLSMENEDE